jgi:hypothetical protein
MHVEINLQAGRVMYQDKLSDEEYRDHMMDGVDDLQEHHLEALREIEKENLQVARAYNQNV